MKVILKKDVENLGSKGDIVNVAPGFGRNYLIPKQLAIEVTSSNMKMIEIERQALKKKLEKDRQSFEGLIQNLNQVALSFERKSGEKDVIFGSVSSSDIKEALHELGFEIDKRKILLEEPIKRLGNYSVPIKIFQEDKAEIKVEVIKPSGETGEEKKEEEVPEEKMEEGEEREKPEEGKKDKQEKTPEEQLKEDVVVRKETEGEKEEKKEEEEIPEDKKEEIEEESIKPEVEMLEEKREEGEMPSDEEEKAEAGVEKEEEEGKKDKNEKKRENKRSKK